MAADYSLFMGLDAQPAPGTERVVVLPVPYEATVSYQAGTAEGPAAIIKASGYIEFTDERSGFDLEHVGIRTLDALQVRDLDPEPMVACVEAAARPHFEQGRFVLTLGGEHTVSVGAIAAAHAAHPGMGLLHFDAHHDLRLEYWGSKYSHACVVRRSVERLHLPVASIGIRAFCPDEKEFAQSAPIPTCYGWECAGAIEKAFPLIDALPKEVYITLDVDALDAAVMPATGTPEPHGLHYHELCALIAYCAQHHRIVGADVVELSPRPGLHFADYTAARLAAQLVVHALK
jgi:agmatinase